MSNRGDQRDKTSAHWCATCNEPFMRCGCGACSHEETKLKANSPVDEKVLGRLKKCMYRIELLCNSIRRYSEDDIKNKSGVAGQVLAAVGDIEAVQKVANKRIREIENKI